MRRGEELGEGEMRRTTGTPVSLQVVQPMVQPCENHMEPPLLARPSLALRESGSIICAAGTHIRVYPPLHQR